MKFIKNHKSFCLFAVMAVALITVSILAPVIAPHDPLKAVLQNALQKPSAEHICGTDPLGRDVFSRILYGGRTSIASSLFLVSVILLIGTALGSIAGFMGGAVDAVIMRISDMMISFPNLILAIAIAGILGPSLPNAMIAIVIVSWTKYARLSRSLVLKIKSRPYVEAARMTGCKNRRLLGRYMLSNALPTMIITAATDIGTVMLSLASLSFLGFGIQPPAPEWGSMLNEGRKYFLTAPWLLIFPGIALLLLVIVFNLLGDSLRDVLDPQQ